MTTLDLLDLLATEGMPSARGRRPSPLSLQFSRELNEGDLEAIFNPAVKGVETRPLVKLRNQHHALARLIAEGRPGEDCSFITGYSISRISILKNDPAFAELVEYYKTQVTEQYLDVHARLAALGLNSIEELQDRLDTEPDKFTKKELMDLAELCFDRSVAPAKTGGKNFGGGAGGNVSVQVNFVEAQPQKLASTITLVAEED